MVHQQQLGALALIFARIDTAKKPAAAGLPFAIADHMVHYLTKLASVDRR